MNNLLSNLLIKNLKVNKLTGEYFTIDAKHASLSETYEMVGNGTYTLYTGGAGEEVTITGVLIHTDDSSGEMTIKLDDKLALKLYASRLSRSGAGNISMHKDEGSIILEVTGASAGQKTFFGVSYMVEDRH